MNVAKPKRQLNLFDTVCIIVGVIVGAGLYETTPVVASSAGGFGPAIGVWLFGGATALIAALCYAELSTSFPRSGGDFVYLSVAYDPRLGNLFAWCEFWIIRPGNIGMMAYVFADYTRQVWPLGLQIGDRNLDAVVYASVAVILLTLLNLAGVRSGKTTQNFLTVLKTVGLFGLSIGLLLLAGHPQSPLFGAATVPETTPEPASESATADWSSIRFAILMAMFAYGGWADMVNVAEEVRDPRRNLLRALVLGSLAVTLVYVVANLAFFHALGYQGVAESEAVAVDAANRFVPNWGGTLISLLVGVSCLGAVNAMLMAGSRIIYAAGEANPTIKLLGVWSPRFDAPVFALLTQSGATLLLIIGLGYNHNDGFAQLLIFTSPVYWSFALLVAVGLFRLRRLSPDEKQPFRTPLFPLTPAAFVGLCAFMLYSGVTWAYSNRQYSTAALVALGVVLLGVVFVWVTYRGPQHD